MLHKKDIFFRKVVVQKFGGSSLSDINAILSVAQNIVKQSVKKKIILVVSALLGVTNKLIAEVSNIDNPNDCRKFRELDSYISTGENASAALMAICLQKFGIRAVSMQGWQVPIITDNSFSNSKILEIKKEKILKLLDEDVIPVITGFQGVDESNNITTLGRGGTDITALAIAASIGIKECEIYKDVSSLYSIDPRLSSKVVAIPRISYDNMMEMSYLGAKILEKRAVAIAKKYGISINILNIKKQNCIGTKISNYFDKNLIKKMETSVIDSVNIKNDFSHFILENISNDLVLELIEGLEQNSFDVSFLNFNQELKTLSFNVPLLKKNSLNNYLSNKLSKINYRSFSDFAYVSLIGINLDHIAFVKSVISLLRKIKVNLFGFSISNIKIILLLKVDLAEKAAVSLHDIFIKKDKD